MDIFEIIISPFIVLIEKIFAVSYQLTNNLGLSIILLSFCISLLLLPVFIFIEKAKKRNDVIKNKIQPVADEIKRCYRGQERHYYLQTLNRQANYNPITAILPAFTLLLQIPFFIAAYWFLENYIALKGVSFGFISDLSEPDAVLGNIHILPIIMTLVNLVSGFYYTRHGNTTERKQIIIVAIVFLIMLFNLPSGLVLYWTMNNVFSFFRLFITNKEVFKKPEKKKNNQFSLSKQLEKLQQLKPNLIKVFVLVSVIIAIVQISSSDSISFISVFYGIFKSLVIALGATLGTAIFGILLYPRTNLSGNFKQYYKQLWPLYKNVFYIIGLAAVYSQYNWAREYQSYNDLVVRIPASLIGSFVIAFIIAFAFLLIQNKISIAQIVKSIVRHIKQADFSIKPVYIAIAGILSLYFWGAASFYYGGFNYTLLIYTIASAASCILLLAIYLIKGKGKRYLKAKASTKPVGTIYAIALIYISSLIYFFNPIIVYSSFPEVFSFPAIDLFAKNLLPFVIIIASGTIIFHVVPKSIKQWLAAFMVTFALLSFVNNFIAPYKVGTLQLGKYINAKNLTAQPTSYIIEATLLITAVLFTKNLLLKKYIKQSTNVIGALLLILISQSFITGTNTGNFFERNEDAINRPSNISFSKDKENILYIIPDMFLGMHMNQIIKESPELIDQLDGFTWYPNTISVSTNTGSSICSLYGGPESNIDKLNDDKRHTMTEKITSAAEKYVAKVKSKGYFFTSTHMPYSSIDARLFDAYLPSWHTDWNKWNSTLNIGGTKDLDYSILWKNALFYSAPLALKPRIYNYGNWVNIDDQTNKNSQLTQNLNFTRLWPYISDTLNNKKSFVYIHSEATHVPWHTMDKKGLLQKDVTPYKNHKWFIHQLVYWFNWMKKNGVYDNTKIVIVSDHGAFPPDTLLDGNYASPYNWSEKGQEKISEAYFWRVNPVLMVKDYNERHELKQDWRLMTNSDAPSILFDKQNILKQQTDTNRTVPVFFVEHDSKITTFKNLEIFKQFEISGNIYNPKNWKQISEHKH